MSKSILCFGRERLLTETRQRILEKAGFACHAAHSLEELERCLREHSVNLLVICHSTSDHEYEVAKNLAQSRPHPALILVLSAGRRYFDAGGGDAFLDSREGPKGLLVTVSGLLNENNQGVATSRNARLLFPRLRHHESQPEIGTTSATGMPFEGD